MSLALVNQKKIYFFYEKMQTFTNVDALGSVFTRRRKVRKAAKKKKNRKIYNNNKIP